MFGGAVRRKGVQVRGTGLETFYLHFYFKKKKRIQADIYKEKDKAPWMAQNAGEEQEMLAHE